MRLERPEKGKKKFPMVEGDLLEFIDGLQLRVSPHIGDVALCSCYNRAGHLFRGDVSYRVSVWRDWVIVDWHRDGKLPNRICVFVDLRALPAHLTRSNLLIHQIRLNQTMNPQQSRAWIGTTLNVDPHLWLF